MAVGRNAGHIGRFEVFAIVCSATVRLRVLIANQDDRVGRLEDRGSDGTL